MCCRDLSYSSIGRRLQPFIIPIFTFMAASHRFQLAEYPTVYNVILLQSAWFLIVMYLLRLFSQRVHDEYTWMCTFRCNIFTFSLIGGSTSFPRRTAVFFCNKSHKKGDRVEELLSLLRVIFFFSVLIRMTTSSLYRRRTLLTINETFCALCNIVQKMFVWRIALVSFSPSCSV